MIKCDINAQTLKQIQSKVATTFALFRKNKESVSTLKQNMVKVLNDVAENYSLTNITEITNIVYNTAQRFGVVDQSSDFFSVDNITNLLTRADQGVQVVDTLETSSDKLTDTEQVRTRLEANKEFLDNAYGLAKEVRTYVVNQTNQNIFDCCFINRGSVGQSIGIVKNSSELNENIRQYQESLLKRMTDYFNHIVQTSPNLVLDQSTRNALQNPRLYEVMDGEIKNTGILNQLAGLAQAYLSSENFTPDILRELYITMNDSTKPQQERVDAKRRLDAYNANVILTHFDSYLSLTLGKAIEIKDFNVKTGENKYQIAGKTSKLTTTWRTSEDINVESEADAITKLAINTTPVYRWQSDTPMSGRHLHFSDFEHTIAKIKDLSYRPEVMGIVFDDNFIMEYDTLWDSLSQETREYLRGKKLSEAINYIRRNPRQYIAPIFELLTNGDFYSMYSDSFMNSNVFTDDELDKMYSLAKGVFDPKSQSSLYSLAGQEFDTDYFSFVTQTADSIFKIGYIQYFRDQDGIIQVRTLIDQSINNIRRGTEQTINTSNSINLIKDFDAYRKELRLFPNTGDFKYITFRLPISDAAIEAKVVASSGSVYFTDLTTGKEIRNFDQLWRSEDVRQFIDSVLRIGVSTDSDFQNALRNAQRSYGEMCKNLMSFASRVILNQYVSHEFIKGQTNADIEKALSDIYGQNAPKYNPQLDELGLVHGNDIPTLKAIAIAKANVQGVTTASQVKDGLNNGQSLQTLSRLLGSLQSQWDLQERKPWSVTNESLLLTVPGLYEGVFTTKEFHSQIGDNKAATAMGVSEMAYSGIVQDFIGGLMSRDDNGVVGNGHVLFLPSVNSDKGTIGRLKIDLNKLVTVNGLQKPIRDLNSAELEALIAQEFGSIYTKMYNAITADWAILDAFIATKGIKAPSLAHSYLRGFTEFNIWWLENGKSLAEYGKTPAEFIKSITLEYNRANRLHPLTIIDQVHYKNAKGNLGINQAFIAQIARFNPQFLRDLDPTFNVNTYPTARVFWDTKKSETLKGLLKARFRVNTTAAIQPELVYIKSTYPSWINDSGDLILAKAIINNREVRITSNRDIATLQEQLAAENANEVINQLSSKYSLQLNPILEQYNYLDYLFTQEFMIATVGSFIAHPEKSKSDDVLQQEAAHFQAQHKRNVSFTAAMHAFQLNLLNGIPEEYNIAVIDDIADEQGTILGLNNGIKPFDGATFVNPFVVILENNSLGGARAGITKKQFVHFKNERTGTGGIIKTAGFGLTNDWIRNSPFLERMMRKMTDHVWLNQDGTPAIVDITTDFKKNKIRYKDFFFTIDKRIYKIVDIKSLGNNTYQRTIQEVGLDGTLLGQQVLESPVTINTNYQLWNFFGGKTSMTMDGRYLKLSNTSIENVVQTMNNVGTVIGDPSRVETQDQLWQPLKQVDVHYVATAGAVKQGAANINSASKYSDDVAYDTQRIKMYQAGIQLDKEHHADDSELSLMTQVIGACAAKGYTLEAAIGLYDALRKSTEIGTREHLDAIRELFITGSETSENVQEVLMKAVVNALGTSQSNGGNFAEIIASDLIRQARQGKAVKFADAMLPLSDNTVYAKVFSIIASYLTNSGIKQKIPGILSVLTPSHNIFKLYGGRKYESFTNPEQELAELQAISERNPVFDVTNPQTNISNLELGRTYRVTRLIPTQFDESGNPIMESVQPKTFVELIRTPTEYHRLKSGIAQGLVTRVVEDVTVGRDLAAYNVRFNTTDGQRFQLWDLDSAVHLFEYNDILEKADKKKTSDEQKNTLLLGIFQRVFPGEVPSQNIEKQLGNYLKRLLQRDLMNLSMSTPALNRQYKQLLDSRDGTQEWYKKYAQWVNIVLGRADGSQIDINGNKVVPRAENFAQIEPYVRQLLSSTTKVKINGQALDIDRASVQTQAYELIMPKTFATNFGLKEFDDLNTIKNDPDFFIKQYLRNQATKVEENQYAVELKVSDGNHYYLLPKKMVIGSGLTKRNNIFTIVIDGRTYRVDSTGNTMYELTPNTEIYVDALGHEVIVTDDLNAYVDSLHFDSVKLSTSLRTRPSIVDSLVKGFNRSKKKAVKSFGRYITAYGEGVDSILQLNSEYHSLTLDNYLQANPTNPIIRAGREKHASFLKSLDIVAARIPAQSMQSFMPMKVVAYDNPDINTAHVSTMQILLQGSDFDVDAVSLATYDIDRNGKLQLWSPYANVESSELLEASMRLPIPSGSEVTFTEIDGIAPAGRFLSKYSSIFNISRARQFNKESKGYDVSDTDVFIDLSLDTPQKIDLFAQFLKEIPQLEIPSSQYYQLFSQALQESGLAEGLTVNHIPSLFAKLKEIADNHNTYFDNLTKYNLSKVVNNYTMYSMYRTINDPVNLIQAQTSVDGTTGEPKRVANRSSEAKEASTRTPGNPINKFEGIVENQVGKMGIAICATGLKAFFGITQYSNFLLNYGTAEQQANLLIGGDHGGITIGGKTYKTLANIRSKDPNTITNSDVLEALASVDNDTDAALVLSALLSLATDNAKELALSKLNAGTKMIGMYIYGLSIGMDFESVANILMSDVGSVIKGVLDGDVFIGREEQLNVGPALFKYFDDGPSRQLYKYDIYQDSKGQKCESPMKVLKRLVDNRTDLKDERGNKLDLPKAIVVFSRSNIPLSQKLKFFEDLRREYYAQSEEARQIYSQLIDFVQDYVQQNHIIGANFGIYEDIRKLSEGAAEMKTLGSILSLNQGIKTSPDQLLSQVNKIERCVYDTTKKKKLEDLIDLTRFAFDEAYREECIAKYERVKKAFNILDVVSKVPHFMGYVQTLATALKEVQNSFKFRSSKGLSLELVKTLGTTDESRIIKGVQNFVGDYLRKRWMRTKGISIVIPKGNQAFTVNGDPFELQEDTVVQLGTDWGDATFRMWLENEVIPNLKRGIKPGSYYSQIADNLFIKDLGNDLLTNTVSRNPSIIYTLPINMLPRIDSERAIFNRYKSAFNQLNGNETTGGLGYQYEVTSYDSDGNQITELSKPIPLVELFTYYAMIADSWKLGEKSLVPILEDFQNVGVIKEFHDFETEVDKSGYALDLNQMELEDILPYVIPSESPYSSYSEYIRYRNPLTKKVQMMRKVRDIKGDEDVQDQVSEYTGGDEVKDPNKIKSYRFVPNTVDTNYFTTGRVENPIVNHRFTMVVGENEHSVSVEFDRDSDKLYSLKVEGLAEDVCSDIVKGLGTIPTTKVNGRKDVDHSLLEMVIKNKLNPC